MSDTPSRPAGIVSPTTDAALPDRTTPAEARAAGWFGHDKPAADNSIVLLVDHQVGLMLEIFADVSFQRQGIGHRLITETHAAAGAGTTLLLVAAPAAAGYYPAIGMVPLDGCWGIRRAF